jgi:hypothetical protein
MQVFEQQNVHEMIHDPRLDEFYLSVMTLFFDQTAIGVENVIDDD